MKQQPRFRFTKIARAVKHYINMLQELAEMERLHAAGELNPIEYETLENYRCLLNR